MVRDRIAEIAEIRSRKGKYGSKYRAEQTVTSCHRKVFDDNPATDLEYIPIRLVTALEVFIRECVADLVDSGEPYISRIKSLVRNIKFDFDLTQSLVDKRVSFGELISHAISVNSISDIDSIVSELTDSTLTNFLDGVTERWSVEVLGEPPVPIIPDVNAVKATLQRLFEVRHVLVHELPEQPPFQDAEVRDFAAASLDFTRAMREKVDMLIYGRYALTQLEMNEEAKESADTTNKVLFLRLQMIDPEGKDRRLQAAQRGWEAFRDNEATFVSRMDMDRVERGSIAPLIYWSSWEKLTKDRIDWLSNHLGDEHSTE